MGTKPISLIKRKTRRGSLIRAVDSTHLEYSSTNSFLKSALEPIILTVLLLYFLNTYIYLKIL